MSYYLLPKIIDNVYVCPQHSYTKPELYVSFSLLNYFNNINSEIINLLKKGDNGEYNYCNAIKMVNTYEFIHNNVPGLNYSVSKLKPFSNLFYDLIEIYNTIPLLDFGDKPVFSLIISQNYLDIIECQDTLGENIVYERTFFETMEINSLFWKMEQKFDTIFYEINELNCFENVIMSLMVVFKNQSVNGNLIIKIDNMFYKPVVDLLYILSFLYDKVYVTKPNSNNVTTFEKYIVCKNFCINYKYMDIKEYLNLNFVKLFDVMKCLEPGMYINQIISYDIPYYFKAKVNDINIIIGQTQLDALDQIISIYKNKNKEEKIDNLKKLNIQKAVTWCEKFKIPCNKFAEKTNIFLPVNNVSSEI